MSKKRYHDQYQTDQSLWQPKAYLTSKHRVQNCKIERINLIVVVVATEAIAKRLEAALPLVINANQTGYIKGRYIGENEDSLVILFSSYTAAKILSDLAIFVDFEKASDSIEWNFLFKA